MDSGFHTLDSVFQSIHLLDSGFLHTGRNSSCNERVLFDKLLLAPCLYIVSNNHAHMYIE